MDRRASITRSSRATVTFAERLGRGDTLESSITDPRTGETSIYVFRNMGVPYPEGTIVKLPDGSEFDKGAFPTALAAEKTYWDRVYALTDDIRNHNQQMELERLKNKGQTDYATSWRERGVPATSPDRG